jgi:hypothetical protein
MVNARLHAQNSRAVTGSTVTPGRQIRHEKEGQHMQHQSSTFTMIMGGVDRSAEFRRAADEGHRSTVALLVLIAALMATTGWLAGIVLIPQAAAATVAADTAPPAPDPYPAVY